MTNALMQARVVSDPVANPLIGAWNEYYLFYVKLRDLADRDDFTDMFTDLNKDMSSLNSAANPETYHYASSIDYVQLCLDRVVEEYFRDEGETTAPILDGLPLAKHMRESWLNSVMVDGDFDDPDLDVDLDADNTIMASELSEAMQTYQFMRMNNLTEMSYEDYLKQAGIRIAPEELHVPELLRYSREWTYPTNTVDASTGDPSSAFSWSHQITADKKRFFKEPGFIFAVTVMRPKVYLKNLDGAAVSLLNNALSWIPAVMADDPRTSLVKRANTEGPLSVVTDAGGYWVDVKDIFLYGDQFLNYDFSSATDKSLVTLPEADLSRKYPVTGDLDGIFSGTNKQIKQDGSLSLNIQTALMDTTPGVPLQSA